jgi:hypothetical protein
VPFTYFSHQAPVVAVKMRWPAHVDATAMAMGSMAPDWEYALNGSRLDFDGHGVLAVLLFCTPIAVVAALVLRRVAPVLFAYVPSPSWMPLRQLRLLGTRRPSLPVTVVSALLGAVSHVVWDLFTHNDRWGARHIALLRSTAVSAFGHDLTWAKVLQYAGHTLGAAIAVLLLARILRSGSLRRWYGLGPDPTTDLAAAPGAGRLRFWTAVMLGTAGGAAWAIAGASGLPALVVRFSFGVAAGLVAGSLLCENDVEPLSAPARGQSRRASA